MKTTDRPSAEFLFQFSMIWGEKTTAVRVSYEHEQGFYRRLTSVLQYYTGSTKKKGKYLSSMLY